MLHVDTKRVRWLIVITIFLIGTVAVWFGSSPSPSRATDIASKQLPSAATQSPKAHPNESDRTVIDQPFKEWATQPWQTNSFADGLRFAKNGDARKRALALEKLLSQRRTLSQEQLLELKRTLDEHIRDRLDDPYVVSTSIRLLAGLLDYMKSRGLASEAEIASEGEVLTQYILDTTLNLQIRGASIRFVGDLGISSGRAAVEEVVSNPANVNIPELARNGCLSLVKLAGEDSFTPIREVFQETSESAVFGTAAFCLGQLNSPEAMSTLVENSHKFRDSESCDAALVNMDVVILETLNHPDSPQVIDAIQATEHLWKDGQREKYIPSLQALLTNAPLEARRAACERLFDATSHLPFTQEKQELSVMLEFVGKSPELSEFAEKIQRRLTATILPVAAGSPSIPTEEKH